MNFSVTRVFENLKKNVICQTQYFFRWTESSSLTSGENTQNAGERCRGCGCCYCWKSHWNGSKYKTLRAIVTRYKLSENGTLDGRIASQCNPATRWPRQRKCQRCAVWRHTEYWITLSCRQTEKTRHWWQTKRLSYIATLDGPIHGALNAISVGQPNCHCSQRTGPERPILTVYYRRLWLVTQISWLPCSLLTLNSELKMHLQTHAHVRISLRPWKMTYNVII
jgi:hypothetical protein